MSEREESHGGGVEELVDRMSWTLHRWGSKEILELVFFFKATIRAARQLEGMLMVVYSWTLS